MNCNKCGSKLNNNDNFCPFCGNKIKNKENIEKIEDLEDIKEKLIDNENIEQKKEIITNIERQEKTNNNSNPLPIVFGIIGLIPFLIPFSIISIVLSYNYKKKTNQNNIGMLLGTISLILQIILIICIVLFNPLEKIKNNNKNNNIIQDSYVDDNTNNYQLIGNNQVGYLTVTKDWSLYELNSNSDILQYRYLNTTVILSLYTITNPNFTLNDYANNINSRIQDYDTDNISIENVNIGKYQAIKQQAYLKSLSSYMTTWCFIDEYNNIHYLALNGTTNPTEHLDIINTFQLTKSN